MQIPEPESLNKKWLRLFELTQELEPYAEVQHWLWQREAKRRRGKNKARAQENADFWSQFLKTMTDAQQYIADKKIPQPQLKPKQE